MLQLFEDLFRHYIRDAWLFAVLHLSFLLYFLYRWRQSWFQTGGLLKALKADLGDYDLFNYAREQIKRYADQGREPDLPRIERYVIGRFDRGTETLRPLVNTFVVIGLMGTLYSLFTLGQQSQDIRDVRQILSRMGIAFSVSFFGIIWALGCSLFLLTPLRQRINYAMQEVERRLTELSAEYPPRLPEHALEQVAQTLRANVNAIGTVITKFHEREEIHAAAQREILTEFRDTTTVVIGRLISNIEGNNARTERTATELKEAVVSALAELKTQFVEISKTWRAELQQTITATEQSSVRLSLSSERLNEATQGVSESLRAVRDSLERTKALGRIVADIEKLTQSYLEQTQNQIGMFKEGLDATLLTVQAIPNEWFTMLTRVSDEFTRQLDNTTASWKEHVENTGHILVTKTELIANNLAPLAESLSPEGRLTQVLADLHIVLVQTKELSDSRAKVDSDIQFEHLADSLNRLDRTLDRQTSQPAPPVIATVAPMNGLNNLNIKVDGIHEMLGDFLSRCPDHFTVPAIPLAVPPPDTPDENTSEPPPPPPLAYKPEEATGEGEATKRTDEDAGLEAAQSDSPSVSSEVILGDLPPEPESGWKRFLPRFLRRGRRAA